MTLHVKTVWVIAKPLTAGVEVVQAEAAPPIIQVTEPAGAVAPEAPVTVAVKIIASPKLGVDTGALITIEGIPLPTMTSSGGVDESAE